MNNTSACTAPPSQLSKPQGIAAKPLVTFGFAVAAAALTMLVLFHALFGIGRSNIGAAALGVFAFLAASGLAALGLSRSYPHQALGYCNLVTLGRLMLVAVLLIVVLAGLGPNWITFGLAAVALCLDGADGWLARRQGLSSDFGAGFDVEVDAAFALLLAVYAASNGMAGPWVIMLGLPHYAFSCARRLWPWLNQSLPDKFGRKAVCVFQIAVLIALQAPLFAQGDLDAAIIAVTLALIWSFGRDIIWLHRTKP